MVLDAVSNFVRGTTDAAVDSTQTTVSVVDASIFPDPATDGEYNVVIWDVNSHPRPDQDPDVEILRVTAIDTGTNDLTVTRGQETTAGAPHPSGSAVHLSPTAKMFGDIESTFADFWDAGAQELTADVNNNLVSTNNAIVEERGVRAYPTSNFAVNNSTQTQMPLDSEKFTSSLITVDTANDVVEIDSSVSNTITITVKANFYFDSTPASSGAAFIVIKKNGSSEELTFEYVFADQNPAVDFAVDFNVTGGDTISAFIDQRTGNDETIRGDDVTFLSVMHP